MNGFEFLAWIIACVMAVGVVAVAAGAVWFIRVRNRAAAEFEERYREMKSHRLTTHSINLQWPRKVAEHREEMSKATHKDCVNNLWLQAGPDEWYMWNERERSWHRVINYEAFINEFKVTPL